MNKKEIAEKLRHMDTYIENISDIQSELIKALGYCVKPCSQAYNNPSFKIEKIDEKTDTLCNGLSLKKSRQNLWKLALNDEIIPGQCALEIRDKNKFGVREVIVHFEVYDNR